MLSLFTEVTIDGFALWVVLLLCLGVFLASFMDAIAGGGGIISCPAHLIAFGSLPAPYALGTNKVSAAIGTVFSTARFIKNGYVDWKLFAPSIAFALTGSVIGTWLQHRTPDAILKYMLLIVLPVVAVITLRNRDWPDEPGEIDFKKQAAIVWSLVTQLTSGYVFLRVGLIAAVFSIAGHYIGAGLAIKNASRIVRPAVIVVLILLTLKVGSELLFPEFWS